MKRKNMPEGMENTDITSTYISDEPSNESKPLFIKDWADKDYTMLENLVCVGATVVELIKVYGTSRESWYKAIRTDERFKSTLENAKTIKKGELMGKAFKSAMGVKIEDTFHHGFKGSIYSEKFEKELPPNEKMLQFLLANLAPEEFNKSNKVDATLKVQRDILLQDEVVNSLDVGILEKVDKLQQEIDSLKEKV